MWMERKTNVFNHVIVSNNRQGFSNDGFMWYAAIACFEKGVFKLSVIDSWISQ